MTAQIKELVTHKMQHKKLMVEHLENIVKDVKDDKIETLILILDRDTQVETEVLGDISCFEAVGMFDTAKLGYQIAILNGSMDHGEEDE